MLPPHAGLIIRGGITAPHGAAMLFRSGDRALGTIAATLAEGAALAVADAVGESTALLEGAGGVSAALVLVTVAGLDTSRAAAGSLLASR
jgi:hypothetical protein